jgi:hypothetical protein
MSEVARDLPKQNCAEYDAKINEEGNIFRTKEMPAKAV